MLEMNMNNVELQETDTNDDELQETGMNNDELQALIAAVQKAERLEMLLELRNAKSLQEAIKTIKQRIKA